VPLNTIKYEEEFGDFGSEHSESKKCEAGDGNSENTEAEMGESNGEQRETGESEYRQVISGRKLTQ
jgi:hypothetical protein